MDAIGGIAVEMKIQDDKTIRKYLLGQASTQEQEEIELWLMAGEDACELLTAAEDDLIDESLAGKLTGVDLEHFNSHFLAAPERKRRLQFGRSLQRAVGAGQPIPRKSSEPDRASFWDSVADFIRYRPAFRYAMSMIILL